MPFFANAVIDIIALFIIAAVVVTNRLAKLPFQRTWPQLRALLFLIAGVLLTDIPAWLLDGSVFPYAREISLVLDTLYYTFQIVYCYVWMLFSDDWQQRKRQTSNRRCLLLALPMVLELAMILLNPFTGWIFSIDAQNVYHRGPFYLVNLLPYYFYIVGSLVIALHGWLRAGETERKQRSFSFIIFMFLPICGVALETLFYGISWTWPFSALSLLMVYLYVQQRQLLEQRIEVLTQREEAAQLKNELAANRIAIMLSQIQPHFLYNALSTIQVLCDKNPALAKQATMEFTEFLRGNMDSLTAEKPISFEWELEHTRHYLALEQIRFGQLLYIQYDIQATLFRLPTLTLQPLVENAVHYGVTKRVKGGTVKISAWEEPAQFVICVSDDGVGFDVSQLGTDDRTHVGIRNVGDRLKSMCGGSLTVESTPGVGTVATIRLPKSGCAEAKAC